MNPTKLKTTVERMARHILERMCRDDKYYACMHATQSYALILEALARALDRELPMMASLIAPEQAWNALHAPPAAPDPDEGRRVVYISGPMTGLPEENFPAFHAKAAELRAAGHTVINPAETAAEDTAGIPEPSWHDYLAAAIRRMEQADAIVYLPGASASHGARIEAIVAEKHDLPILEGDRP